MKRPDAPRSEARAPFRLCCDGCAADIDAPDKEFALRAFVLVADADYALREVHCMSCGATTDAAVWLISKDDLVAESGGDLEQAYTPGSVALIDRYLKLVEQARQGWEQIYGHDDELPECDLSEVLFAEPSERQAVAFPARVLAAARGLRLAVETHPLEDPPGMLRIGQFNCLLSIEDPSRRALDAAIASEEDMAGRPEREPGRRPWCLHLSVNNARDPGSFSKAEQLCLLSLFFTPTEVRLVRGMPGVRLPVIHFYLDVWPEASPRPT